MNKIESSQDESVSRREFLDLGKGILFAVGSANIVVSALKAECDVIQTTAEAEESGNLSPNNVINIWVEKYKKTALLYISGTLFVAASHLIQTENNQ